MNTAETTIEADADVLTIDRRREERRDNADEQTVAEGTERRKKERRRQIDPTTCERDYSGDEVAFMRAMDEYKRKSGRQFPTWSEVLEVLHAIGYRQVAEPQEMKVVTR